ncbi:MAG: cytochrome c peroxidase [Bryobacteraceae bacterium]
MKRVPFVLTASALAVLIGCAEAPKKEAVEPPYEPPQVGGFSPMMYPPDNPMTKAKVELGKALYYDKRLSGDGSRSCYSCHVKEKGLTDGLATAIGAYEAKLTRAAPTMWNVGYYPALYWDGRSGALEKQVLGAWGGGNMGCTGKDGRPGVDDCANKLSDVAGYKSQFEAVFGAGPITKENTAKAVAAFMRTIVTTGDRSAWVRFKSGDQTALSEEAKRGYTVFAEKAKCTNCHDGILLTDMQFHNVGIGMDKKTPDVGRFTVTKEEKDTGAFKTPSLFDVSKSGPYFHDGSVATLEEAVDVMAGGGKKNKFLDTTNLKPYKLTTEEKADLVAFLRSLDATYDIADPMIP